MTRIALVLGIFGCGAQHVEPTPTPQAPARPEHTPTAHVPAHVAPVPTTQAPARLEPTSTTRAPADVEPVPTPNAATSAEPPVLRSIGIERWRAAVEGYVPSIKSANVVPLDGARAPFAAYLNQVHARVHQTFANQFIASLDHLPSSDPMNRADLHVMLEIIVESREGRIHRMGVTATSGLIAFDVNALDSVYRAQPFGPPPRAILSPDGFVYFHWEFYRDEQACGTWNARPFLLGSAPRGPFP